MDDDGFIWSVAAGVATLAAVSIARKALAKGWAASRGAVPGSAEDERRSWGEAVTFAVVSGAVVGLARMVAQRGVQAAKEGRGKSATA